MKAQYINDPCGTSSIPYWKAICISVPENMQILHDRDFGTEMLKQYTDEPYFRLIHNLDSVEPVAVPVGYSLRQGTAEEFAAHIEECYGNGMTAGKVRSFAERHVYCKQLWIALCQKATGEIVATGIGELDREIGEGVLEWIQVSKEHRGKGLGRYMVRELLWRMKAVASFATVSGRCENPLDPETLYRKCGFVGNDIWHVMKRK